MGLLRVEATLNDPAVQGRVGAVVNAGAAQVNKQVGLGSSLKKSLQDAEPPGFAQSSGYKQDFCAAHQQVGRRAVVHSPQAKEAVSERAGCLRPLAA